MAARSNKKLRFNQELALDQFDPVTDRVGYTDINNTDQLLGTMGRNSCNELSRVEMEDSWLPCLELLEVLQLLP